MEVTLRGEELTFAYLIGRARRRRNEGVQVRDLKVGDADPWELDVEGMAAELAFCRAANVFPDTDTRPRADSPDCVLPSGLVVDVKGTSREDGNLIAPTTKHKNEHTADIAILVVGKFPFSEDGKGWDKSKNIPYVIHGWAWNSDLLSRCTLRNLRKPTHFIDRSDLYKELPLLRRPSQPSLLQPQGEETSVDSLFG